MLSFDYRQAMDLDDLPLMDAAELRDRLTGAVAEGWRVLAFFGLPEAARGPDASGPVGLCCVLGHDAARMLTVLRTPRWSASTLSRRTAPRFTFLSARYTSNGGWNPWGIPGSRPCAARRRHAGRREERRPGGLPLLPGGRRRSA